MNRFSILVLLLATACSVKPGSIKTLTRNNIAVESESVIAYVRNDSTARINIKYLGCGGLSIESNGEVLLVDPFFSHQRMSKIGRSVLLSKKGKSNFISDTALIRKELFEQKGHPNPKVSAILNTHSHYDHLMDVPAIYAMLDQKTNVYLSESGYNTCYYAIDTSHMFKLEEYADRNKPIQIRTELSRVNIYPVRADHNPHFHHVKFFAGSNTKPSSEFGGPFERSKPNLWLEGNVFSFVIDVLDDHDHITFRAFVQSSSCNPPAGIPNSGILEMKSIDVAFLGVASYEFSPNYPAELLETIIPSHVVWMHWEDFFRPYNKSPRTLRGTNVRAFFELPAVTKYKNHSKIVYPGATLTFVY